MHLRILITLIFFSCALELKAQKEKDMLGDHFNARVKAKERTFLKGGFTSNNRNNSVKSERSLIPDFYAKVVKEVAEHNQLPSFFNKAIQREKERTLQPDFFQKGIFSKERTMQADHFKSNVSNRKRGMQADHFSSDISSRERALQPDFFGMSRKGVRASDQDLEMKAKKKRLWKKNFIGERWRIFNIQPNSKEKREKRKGAKKRDAFGRDARELDAPQAPKNEMDLFNGGVMPKMKDLR